MKQIVDQSKIEIAISILIECNHSGQKGLCFRQSLYKGSVIRNDQKS